MEHRLLLDDLNRTIDFWATHLEQYSFTQLSAKPSRESWSLGQVYMHLIENAYYYFEQIKTCVSTNANADKEASSVAKKMLLANEFPDELIEGPPENADTPQPLNKEQLVQHIKKIKDEIIHIDKLISSSRYKGKTKHPGLYYFSAAEWLQFTDMHFRHHLRQKSRLDDFLKANNIH